jgi:hypothetical protein
VPCCCICKPSRTVDDEGLGDVRIACYRGRSSRRHGMGARRQQASGAAVGALGVTAAVTAFVLSGEVELSIAFLAWDLLQVLLVAVVTRALVRRAAHVRHQEPHGERPA